MINREQAEPRRSRMIRLVLFDANEGMVEAWRGAFGEVGGTPDRVRVVVRRADVRELVGASVLVSPSNGGLFFDGGIDRVYAEMFPSLQANAQRTLGAVSRPATALGRHMLPVGEVLFVPTGRAAIPIVACAPTMDFPEDISATSNVYIAFRALMEKWHRLVLDPATYGVFHTLACPGLGTGVGRMSPKESARQMKRAFDEVWTEERA